VPIIPEFLYFIRHRHDPVSNMSLVEASQEPFATYTTSTLPTTLLADGAYEASGTNISNLCFAGSNRRKIVLLFFFSFNFKVELS
jgi:hypothetical protein